MKKGLIIFAVILIIAGIAIFVGAYSSVGYDITKLSTAKAETNTYAPEGAFTKIEIDSNTTDVVFKPAEDGKLSVVCLELEKAKHTVAIEDGTLQITVEDNRQWLDYIGFFFEDLTMTVYLPETAYESVKVNVRTGDIKIPAEFSFGTISLSTSTGNVGCCASASGYMSLYTSTGDIKFENVHAAKVDFGTSTGEVMAKSVVCDGEFEGKAGTGDLRLENVTGQNITCRTSTGAIMLKDVIAAQKLTVKCGTGDVRFDKCDADEIEVKTSTGDVSGTLLTEKMFVCGTGTGRVRVPQTTSEHKCEITTHTGDITIKIAND